MNETYRDTMTPQRNLPADHSRTAVLEKLRGEVLTIDGLRSAFDGWTFEVHPDLGRIRLEIDQWLTSNYPLHPKLAKLRKGDYGLFGATWWPRAPFERLRVATYLAVWLFVWDDEIDSTVGSLANDFATAQNFRKETKTYIEYALGLSNSSISVKCTNSIIISFKPIADALRSSWSMELRHLFLLEIGDFLEKSETEQRVRLEGRLPTMEEFWQYRLGTSAVRVVLALNTYCCELDDIPISLLEDKHYRSLLDLINVNICAVNDLLSAKKELAQGAIENLVALLYASTGSTTAASESIMEIVRVTKTQFDVESTQSMQRYACEENVAEAVRKLVDGCRFYSSGNLDWSLTTGRYGVNAHEADHIVIQL